LKKLVLLHKLKKTNFNIPVVFSNQDTSADVVCYTSSKCIIYSFIYTLPTRPQTIRRKSSLTSLSIQKMNQIFLVFHTTT